MKMAVQETAAQLSMALKVQEYPTLKVWNGLFEWKSRLTDRDAGMSFRFVKLGANSDHLAGH